MVIDKGHGTWTPAVLWAAMILGSGCLTAIVRADSVVIHAERETLNNAPGVVRRQGMSLESCAEACAKETQITCKFFKYLNDSGTCLLSATDNPNINRMAYSRPGTLRTMDLGGGSGRKSMTAWLSELDEKVDELQDQESDVENLKAAVTDIRDELKMLRKSRVSESHRNRASKEAQQTAYTQLTRKIVGLKVDGEKFKAAVHALSNMQRVLAKEIGGAKDEQKDVLLKVAELEKTAGDISTLMASLKATDSGLQRELDSVKDGTNDLATKFSKLRDRINQEIANKQMPPGMVKLKHNQGALATALESMTDKVSSLMARLPFLEKELRGTNQKVSNQAMYERELQSKLKVLYKNLIEIKKSVHNLLDPRSAVNMERAKGVLKLKSDVSMLAELDKGLKNELQEQREDMARLVKDVARVQLMAQNLKDKLTLVLTASRQFQQDIAVLKNGQKNGLSVVEVAQMQKQVLIALNRLKTREAILMKQLNKYRSSVNKVAKQVSRSSNKKTHVQRVVRQLRKRLGRFNKQMQILFDRTERMTRKLKRPAKVKGMTKLLKDQAQTSATLGDLLSQLGTMRRRINVLSTDLKDTREEAETEKKEMAKEVRQRQREMRQRQKELRQKARQEKKEDKKLMKQKERLMAKRRKKERQRMRYKLRLERKRRKKERQRRRYMQRKARKRKLRRQRAKMKKQGKGLKKWKKKKKKWRGGKGKIKRKRKKGRGKKKKKKKWRKKKKGRRKKKKKWRKKKKGRGKKKKKWRKKKKGRGKKKKKWRKKKKGRGKKKNKWWKKKGGGKKKKGWKKAKGKNKQEIKETVKQTQKTTGGQGKPVVTEKDTIVISKNPQEAREALEAVEAVNKPKPKPKPKGKWKKKGRKKKGRRRKKGKRKKKKGRRRKKGKRKKKKGRRRKKGKRKKKKGKRRKKGKRKKKKKGKKKGKWKKKGKGKRKGKGLTGSVSKSKQTVTKKTVEKSKQVKKPAKPMNKKGKKRRWRKKKGKKRRWKKKKGKRGKKRKWKKKKGKRGKKRKWKKKKGKKRGKWVKGKRRNKKKKGKKRWKKKKKGRK